MAPPRFLLGSKYLPLDSTRLGRLVTNTAKPHESYYQANPPIDRASHVVKSSHIKSFENRGSGNRWLLKLLGIVSFGSSKQTSSGSSVDTSGAMDHQLDSPKEYFSKMLENPLAQEWILEAYKDDDGIYFVSGIQTFVDAKFAEYETKQRSPRLTFGDFNAVVQGDINGEVDGGHTFTVSGEQIYAIEYYKVKVTVKATESPRFKLKECEWVPTGTRRQAQATETSEVMAAELAESEFTDEDTEGWTKEVTETGDVFYLCE